MCRKNTVALNTIYDMCSAQNLDPKEYLLKAKLLLGSYRHICWASLGVCKVASDDDFYICDENIRVGLDYLASYSPAEEKRNFEKQLKAMFDSSWMVQLVDDTMIQVTGNAALPYGAIIDSLLENRRRFLRVWHEISWRMESLC